VQDYTVGKNRVIFHVGEQLLILGASQCSAGIPEFERVDCWPESGANEGDCKVGLNLACKISNEKIKVWARETALLQNTMIKSWAVKLYFINVTQQVWNPVTIYPKRASDFYTGQSLFVTKIVHAVVQSYRATLTCSAVCTLKWFECCEPSLAICPRTFVCSADKLGCVHFDKVLC